jgi:hypothetical protein
MIADENLASDEEEVEKKKKGPTKLEMVEIIIISK